MMIVKGHVLMAVGINITVCWDMTPCSLVDACERLRENHCACPYSRTVMTVDDFRKA